MAGSRSDQLRRFYDQQATIRLARGIPQWRDVLRERFLELWQPEPGLRVLDLGAGAGPDSTAFASAGVDVVALDISDEHARILRDLGVRAVVADMTALPFGRATFDAVWAMSSLLHIPDSDLSRTLAGIDTVLQPGGLVSVGVWGGDDREGVADTDAFDPPRFFSSRSDRRFFGAMRDHFEPLIEESTKIEGHANERYQWFVGCQRSGTSST